MNPLGISTESIHTAAVCVYPMRLKDAIASLADLDEDHKISIATG